MIVSSARAIFIYEVLWYALLWGGCKSGENGPSPRNAGSLGFPLGFATGIAYSAPIGAPMIIFVAMLGL